MISSINEFYENHVKAVLPLDSAIPTGQYAPLDLSISNVDLMNIKITDPDACQGYIDIVLHKNDALVAYGGYLEKRNIYADKSSFSKSNSIRNIHLGVDFWAAAGTKVITPINGKVHSFQNNATIGDYGPTIILQHQMEGFVYHSLYGHLSLVSLNNLEIGQELKAGDQFATIGTPDINVNYAPHLHFQIIIDMEGSAGDYPGVCSEDKLDFYRKNCPDPNLIFNL